MVDFDSAPLLTDEDGEKFYHINLKDKIPELSDKEKFGYGWRTDHADGTTDQAHYEVLNGAIPANTKDWNSLSPSDSYESITVL